MKTSFITNQTVPLVIEPENGNSLLQHLTDFIATNKDEFEKNLYGNGAVLFRGFEVSDAVAFEKVALTVDKGLVNDYYGTSPRNIVKGTSNVFTASELPGFYPIMQHCEMSYVPKPPIKLFFYCDVEPEYGGETPLCDFRKIYCQLNDSIREEFERKGVITIRNYSAPGKKSKFNLFELKSWEDIFHTNEKAEVERQCKEQKIDFEWLENGKLRLKHATAAFHKNPVTGEPAWFNHLQVFHPAGGAIEYNYIHNRQQRFKTFCWKWFIKSMVAFKQWKMKPEDQSMNVVFGDGTAIPNSYVAHVEELIWENISIFKWRKGDVLCIDNFSVAHGRLPFEGNRNILVCWTA